MTDNGYKRIREVNLMKSLFEKQLVLVGELDNPERKFNHLIATVRSLLQYAAIGAFEKFDFQNVQENSLDQSHIVGLLRAPTDTSPIQILDKLIPCIRSFGMDGILPRVVRDFACIR